MSLVSILAVPRTLVGKWAQNLHSYTVEQFLIERQKAKKKNASDYLRLFLVVRLIGWEDGTGFLS